ncbi:MAG: hypothetical protein AB7P50_00705 [Alphaproteobacteria bacterium]
MSLILDKDNPLATKIQTRCGQRAVLLDTDCGGSLVCKFEIEPGIWRVDTWEKDGCYFRNRSFGSTRDLINVPVERVKVRVEREYEKVAEFTEDGLWTPPQMPLVDAATKEFLRYIESTTKDSFNDALEQVAKIDDDAAEKLEAEATDGGFGELVHQKSISAQLRRLRAAHVRSMKKP